MYQQWISTLKGRFDVDKVGYKQYENSIKGTLLQDVMT